MKIHTKTVIALCFGLLATAPVFASHGDLRDLKQGGIGERLERQQHRIQQGVKQHQLTHREARQLRAQQRDIRYLAKRFSKDGKLSKRERRILTRQLKASSLQIKRLKHNELYRYVDMHERYGHHTHAHRL